MSLDLLKEFKGSYLLKIKKVTPMSSPTQSLLLLLLCFLEKSSLTEVTGDERN